MHSLPWLSRRLHTWLPTVGALVSIAATAGAQPDDRGSGAVPRGADGAVRSADEPAQPSDQPRVVAPQLKQFVEAPYPEEAKREGLEATVVLQLDIDAQGRVADVQVVNPAGRGFDEAATSAARQFQFEPALRDGKPTPARILYRYTFTMKAAEPEAPAPGEPAAPLRNLTGQVRSTEGDFPLAGASVTVVDEAGREYVASTDEEGRWAFDNLPPGSYRVRVAAPGYQSLELREQIAADEITEVVYRVPAEGTLEVVIQGKRPPREVTKRTLQKREIERIPGTSGDALRSIQSLPGVARPPAIAGFLVVRGSSPNSTDVFIEGSLVPLVYHFGGLSSVVPTELLDKIDFYPGNFSVQYGRVMGGIVDVGLRSPKNDGRYHGMGQVDLIDARALLEGPVPLVKGWTFAAAVRRSWFDLWLKPVLTEAGASVTAAPVYYDYQAYVETEPTSRSRLRVGVIGSDDRLEILTREASDQEPSISGNIAAHTNFYRVFVDYRSDLSDDVSLWTTTAVGNNKIEFGLGTLFFFLDSDVLTHRTELTTRLGKGATLHTGIDMFYSPVRVEVRAPQPPRPGEPDPGPFAGRPPLTLKTDETAYRPAAYAELELAPYPRVKLVPGVRVDYAKDTERWDVSPRFNWRYAIAQEFPTTTLKGGVGLFQQPPQFQETFPPFGTPGLLSNRAVHYSLGTEQDLTRQVEVSVEGFYKSLDRIVSRSPSAAGNYDYNNVGSGYVIGSELLLKYKPDQRFFGWIAYTLSRSLIRDNPDDDLRLTSFDQTHILTALGSYVLGRGWEFGARYRIVSGNPQTPIVGGLYNANSGAYANLNGEPLSERLPLFTQLDLRVDKKWDFQDWRLSTYLDVQNVYYSQNVEGYAYNYNYTQRRPITGLPIIPSIGIRGEF